MKKATPSSSEKKGYDYYQEIGERIIYKNNGVPKIVITNNSSFLSNSGIGFILMGVLFIVFIFFSSSTINAGAVLIASSLLVPFFAVGLRYYLRSRKSQSWCFELDNKQLVIKEKTISFYHFAEFTLTKLQSARPTGGSYSFQLNMTAKEGKEFLLFSNEDYTAILFLAEFLSQQTNIPLNRTIYFA